jgi:signal transduction histidine kinase
MSLKFEDDGLGFDLQAYGDKIFGLYKRFHPHVAEGKGVGLFMVKTQVENLGGEISIESEPGRRTVFTILL